MLGPNVITHLIGIALVTIAFLVFGRGIVRRSKGKSFNPLPAFLLILAALGFQIFYPEDFVTNRIGHLLLDFGVGMVLAAGYLWINREQAKMFWVPGALGIIAAGVVYLFSFVVNIWGDMKNQPETIQLLVELGEDDELAEIKPILRKYCATAERAFPNVDMSEDVDLAKYYLVYVDSTKKDPLMMELRNDRENVDQLDLNRPVSLIRPIASEAQRKSPVKFLANDPCWRISGMPMRFNTMRYTNISKVKAPKNGKKALVAIVDTGVDKDHEDLSSVL